MANCIISKANFVHPIGSIYMTTDGTFNPNNVWVGTWSLIKDVFLLGAGDTYTIGSTGGEATHKLTVDEMPSHNHKVTCQVVTGGCNSGSYANSGVQSSPTTTSTGGGQAHNNMPPYLTVNIWNRTA